MTRRLAPPGPLPRRGGPKPPKPKPPATRRTEAGEGKFAEAIYRLYATWLAAGPPRVR